MVIKRTPAIKDEIWKVCAVMINGKLVKFPDYEVSNYGRVKRRTKNNCRSSYIGKIMKFVTLKGYKLVNLYTINNYQRMVRVHRLVSHAFLGPCPKDMQVNHKDGNKANNHISNLEYVTSEENVRHAWKTGLANYYGTNNLNSSLSDNEVISIKKLLNRKIPPSYKRIAEQFGVSESVIKGIKFNRTYRNIGEEVKQRNFLKFRKYNFPNSLGKLTKNDVAEIRKRFIEDANFNKYEIAKKFNVGPLAIHRIVRNITWNL